MSVWMILAVACVAYLIGAIPVGYVVVFAIKGTDVRKVGSGRMGGTNALRAGGLVAGLLTAVGDVIKGLLAVTVARAIAGQAAVVEVLAGLMAVIGHNWSVYMGFKGGAGTAPNIGASIAFWPISGLYLVPMVPFGLYVIGYASLTSLIVAAMIMTTFIVRAALGVDPDWRYAIYSVLAAGAVVWALRPNIQRLRNGTERRAGLRGGSDVQSPPG